MNTWIKTRWKAAQLATAVLLDVRREQARTGRYPRWHKVPMAWFHAFQFGLEYLLNKRPKIGL